MKKSFLRLFLWAVMALPIGVLAQTYQSVPYTTGFEDVSHTSLPTGWVNYATGSSSAATFPCAYSHAPNARNGSMYFELESSSGQTEISATCEFEYLQTLMLDFYAATTNSTKPTTFEIGVMEGTVFVPVDTIDLITASGWGASSYNRYRVYFDEYYGDGTRIAFRAQKSGSYTVMIDDITIAVAPSCIAMPGNVTAVPGDTYVDLSWIAASSSLYYGIYLDGTHYTSYDTSYTVTGLTPNTIYNGYVYNLCSAGDTSESVPFTFRTTCAPMTVLPYLQDFESENTGGSMVAEFANCWNRLNNGTSYFGYPYISSSSTYNHTSGGSKGLYWYNSSSTGSYGDYQCIILPPVDTTVYDIYALQLSFWVKSSSTSYNPVFYVGVMTDPTDINTFQATDTINVGGNTNWAEFTSYLTNFTGYGQYVAIKAVRPASTWTAYMDDIKLELTPDCPPVSNIALTTLDSNMLTLTWNENGDATSWTIEYGTHGFTQGNGISTVVTSLPFTISGLTPNTEYDIYVTPDCTGDIIPSAMATFRTANVYVNLPLSCGFEDTVQNNIWTLANGTLTNKWYIGSAASNDGTNSLFVSNDGISLNYTISSSTMVFAYCDVMIPNAGTYAYSYDWKCNGESSYDYLRVALVPISTELVPASTVPTGFGTTGLPAGWIAIDGGSKLNLQSNWQTRTSDINITTPGVYHLVFAFRCDGSGGTAPAGAIDNVQFAALSCDRPASITINNITQTTADASWPASGTVAQWEYQVDNGPITTVYDTTCSLMGLSANTAYTLRVRAVCGAGDTSLWASTSFRTLCGYVTLPYTETFEGYPAGSSTTGSDFIPCWSHLNNGTSYGGYPYLSNSASYNHTPGGNGGLYWYNATTAGTYGDYQCIVLPAVDPTVNTNSLLLSFWAKSSSTSYYPVFIVGVMTNPIDITTFVPVDTVYVSGTDWQLFEVPLARYAGTGNSVAIRANRPSSLWYAYVDDVTLDYAPTCYRLDEVRTDVTVAAGSNHLALTWDDASAYSYEVQYGNHGFTLGSGTTLTTSVNSITITGLSSLTSYDVYVRKICTVGDTSQWVMGTFMTAMCDNAQMTTIGSENSTGTTYYAPVNNYYKYTLSQTIIDSAELGGAQMLTAISYYYQYATASSSKTNCSIYLQPTTLSSFASSSDAVALDSNAVLVYTGELNCQQGWNIFGFDTNYYYNGIGNLMVIVDDNSNAYNGSAYLFKTEPCSGNKTIYYYSDSNNPDPATPSSFSGSKAVASWRNVMQLISCGGQVCAAPVITSAAATIYDATITWSGSGSAYEVAIKASNAPVWSAEVAVSSNSYTFTGLTPATTYAFRVRQDCAEDSLGYSEWTYGSFTTDSLLCPTPTDLTASNVAYNQATIGWTSQTVVSNWELHVWNNFYDRSIITANTSEIIDSLYPSSTYNAAVRALCGIDLVEGEWSDTITFTTPTCPEVSGLAASNVTFHEVDLNWNSDPMAINWIVEYGFHGFGQGQGTTVTVTTNSYHVTNLLPGESYDFYVRTVCASDWTSEHWSSVTISTVEMPEDMYTVTLDVNDPTMGVVGGAGVYPAGTTITILATPFNGYHFVSWSDNNTDATRTLVVNNDITLTATFEANQTEGIDDIEEACVVIYPNPASTSATISLKGFNGMARIAVTDMSGRTIAVHQVNSATDSQWQMNLDQLAEGTYFVSVTAQNKSSVQKLIVK